MDGLTEIDKRIIYIIDLSEGNTFTEAEITKIGKISEEEARKSLNKLEKSGHIEASYIEH